jgi:hypothetical protein
MTWEFIRHQRGQLWVKFLPGYAPERNPVECTCGRTGSTTSCRTFADWQLSLYARRALRRMQKRPTLVIALLASRTVPL